MQSIFMRTIADCCHRRAPSIEHSNEKKQTEKLTRKRTNKKNLEKEFY